MKKQPNRTEPAEAAPRSGVHALNISDRILAEDGAELVCYTVTYPVFEEVKSTAINAFYAEYAARCAANASGKLAASAAAEYAESGSRRSFKRYVYEADFRADISGDGIAEIRMIRRVLRCGKQLGLREAVQKWSLRTGGMVRIKK